MRSYVTLLNGVMKAAATSFLFSWIRTKAGAYFNGFQWNLKARPRTHSEPTAKKEEQRVRKGAEKGAVCSVGRTESLFRGQNREHVPRTEERQSLQRAEQRPNKETYKALPTHAKPLMRLTAIHPCCELASANTFLVPCISAWLRNARSMKNRIISVAMCLRPRTPKSAIYMKSESNVKRNAISPATECACPVSTLKAA